MKHIEHKIDIYIQNNIKKDNKDVNTNHNHINGSVLTSNGICSKQGSRTVKTKRRKYISEQT